MSKVRGRDGECWLYGNTDWGGLATVVCRGTVHNVAYVSRRSITKSRFKVEGTVAYCCTELIIDRKAESEGFAVPPAIQAQFYASVGQPWPELELQCEICGSTPPAILCYFEFVKKEGQAGALGSRITEVEYLVSTFVCFV